MFKLFIIADNGIEKDWQLYKGSDLPQESIGQVSHYIVEDKGIPFKNINCPFQKAKYDTPALYLHIETSDYANIRDAEDVSLMFSQEIEDYLHTFNSSLVRIIICQKDLDAERIYGCIGEEFVLRRFHI